MGSEDTSAIDFAKKFNKPRLGFKFFNELKFLAQYSVRRDKTFPKILNDLI